MPLFVAPPCCVRLSSSRSLVGSHWNQGLLLCGMCALAVCCCCCCVISCALIAWRCCFICFFALLGFLHGLICWLGFGWHELWRPLLLGTWHAIHQVVRYLIHIMLLFTLTIIAARAALPAPGTTWPVAPIPPCVPTIPTMTIPAPIPVF